MPSIFELPEAPGSVTSASVNSVSVETTNPAGTPSVNLASVKATNSVATFNPFQKKRAEGMIYFDLYPLQY